MFFQKLLLPIFIAFLLSFLSFVDSWGKTPEKPNIPSMEIQLITYQQPTPLQTKSLMILETKEILANVHNLTALSTFQLPGNYLYLHFPQPVHMPPFSPINHPIEEMIITLPQHRTEPHHLLIRNPNRQWLEYETTRSLDILIRQIKAWNPTIKKKQ